MYEYKWIYVASPECKIGVYFFLINNLYNIRWPFYHLKDGDKKYVVNST